MGRIKLESLSDFARQGDLVRVNCTSCAKQAGWDPVDLMRVAHACKLSMAIDALEQRMKCFRCGAPKAAIRPVFADR